MLIKKLLKTKKSPHWKQVNNLENKIANANILNYLNQYHRNKQIWKKRVGYVDKKLPLVSRLVTTTVLNTAAKLRIKFLLLLI